MLRLCLEVDSHALENKHSSRDEDHSFNGDDDSVGQEYTSHAYATRSAPMTTTNKQLKPRTTDGQEVIKKTLLQHGLSGRHSKN